jgi:hypothetical protein
MGRPEEFRVSHVVMVTLTDPSTEPLGTLEHRIGPRLPGPNARPGDEINHNFVLDIGIPLDVAGGYDLAFALDGERVQRHTLTITAVVRR